VVTRAISTVVDVTVCLLLISAAVGTLVVTDPHSVDGTADDTAEQLATTTATVSDPGGAMTRRVYGTHAELLARGAVANLTLSGRSVAPTAAAFRGAVRERVGRLLDRAPERTEVTARWEPYPNAPIGGRLTVGPAPPERATVSTARLTVPIFIDDGLTESADNFDKLAAALAEMILEQTLAGTPPQREQSTRFADRASAYDRALGAASAGDRERALATRLRRDLRDRFATPEAAADALRPTVVRVVIREWAA
jgi:hypothetical protein